MVGAVVGLGPMQPGEWEGGAHTGDVHQWPTCGQSQGRGRGRELVEFMGMGERESCEDGESCEDATEGGLLSMV